MAFSAYRDQSVSGLGKKQIVIFDKVLINDGDGYSQTTGVFIAPVDGAYYFTWNTASLGNKGALVSSISLNGKNVVSAAAEAGKFQMAGNSIILKLKRNDKISIGIGRGAEMFSNFKEGWFYPVFSGTLLYKS